MGRPVRLDEVITYFTRCHICDKNIHPHSQDCCDECAEKVHKDALNDAMSDRIYGSNTE